MTQQIDNRAPVGSLLKQPRLTERKTPRRKPDREHDDDYLALIRRLPCVSCGHDPAGVAAHIRMSSSLFAKPLAGMGRKPDDRWTLPLCNDCHNRQHQIGEMTFWHQVGRSPLPLCVELYKATPDLEKMRALVTKGEP